jgi:hypothetical protein
VLRRKLAKTQTFPKVDFLNIFNQPAWTHMAAGASSLPLMLLACLIFFHNNSYNLDMLGASPIRIRFPESMYDGTSSPQASDFQQS